MKCTQKKTCVFDKLFGSLSALNSAIAFPDCFYQKRNATLR